MEIQEKYRYMNDNFKLLTNFSNAIAVPLYNTDGIKWPIRSGHIISEVGDLYATEYISQLKKLVDNHDPSTWIIAVPNALSIWRMAHHIINGLEKAKIEKKIIAQNCLLMINIIKTITNNDEIFSKSHIILNESVIKNLVLHIDSITRVNELLSLSTLLWAYSEALYFQGREISCEYHGPYLYDKRMYVVVRDYKNFNPSDLWATQNFETDYQNIRIVTFHNHNLSLTIDAYNNVDIPDGGFLDSCIGGVIFVNGYIKDDTTVSNLIKKFSWRLMKQLQYVNTMDDKSLYLQYLRIFWYRKKKLADFLSCDWMPPEDAVERIAQAEIKQNSVNKYKTQKGLEYVAAQYNYSKYL